MANTASLSISATMLPDDISKTISNLSASYTPADASEGWYYKLTDITTTSRDLIASDEDSGNAVFMQMGSTKAMGGVATATASGAIDGSADQVKFVCVRHMGTTDDGSTSTDESIYIGIGVTAAHNTAGNIYIGSGEMVVLKTYATPLASIHAISVTMDGTYGYPSATHSGTVSCQVAAIVDDGGV